MTQGDPSCESSWTIVMLSPVLSWLDSYTHPYDTIENVLQWSVRRALIYPYLRNYDLVSLFFVQDLVDILMSGRRVLVRCLLQIHDIFDKSEAHYLFNKLYLNQIICWLQLIEDDVLVSFATNVRMSVENPNVLSKDQLGLDLVLFENDAFNNEEMSDTEEVEDTSEEVEPQSNDDSSEDEDDDDDEDDTSRESSIEDYKRNTIQKAVIKDQDHASHNTSLLDDQVGIGAHHGSICIDATNNNNDEEGEALSIIKSEDVKSEDGELDGGKKKFLIQEI